MMFSRPAECKSSVKLAHLPLPFSSTGAIDPALVLEQIEAHIATVKDEAFSRKDILEKVERFLNACEEEAWLEDYNKVRMLVNFICNFSSHICFLDNDCSFTWNV
jgi:hypothetical protein